MSDGLSIRGDSAYCPLALSLDCYWNCLTDCHHCYLRRLNRTWGTDLRPIDTEALRRRLINGMKNPRPHSPLAWALNNKNTIRLGNKTDAFQRAERRFKIAGRALEILTELEWSFVIQTKFTEIVRDYEPTLRAAARAGLLWVMPVISPGWNKDWALFERRRTTHPDQRLADAVYLRDEVGAHIGVNGEPFIPGYHTVKEFEETLDRLRAVGITRYNTYNLHLNDHVAKRLVAIGVDLERVWTMNQDAYWRPIQQQLIAAAAARGMILGCPDFVNSGWSNQQVSNTCCGLDVPNPCTFNAHEWKRRLQRGFAAEDVLRDTWDGVGDWNEGASIVRGTAVDLYTMTDARGVK